MLRRLPIKFQKSSHCFSSASSFVYLYSATTTKKMCIKIIEFNLLSRPDEPLLARSLAFFPIIRALITSSPHTTHRKKKEQKRFSIRKTREKRKNMKKFAIKFMNSNEFRCWIFWFLRCSCYKILFNYFTTRISAEFVYYGNNHLFFSLSHWLICPSSKFFFVPKSGRVLMNLSDQVHSATVMMI